MAQKDTKTKLKPKPNPATDQSVKRRLKGPQYKSFRLRKKIRKPLYRLPSSWELFKTAIGTIARRPRLFLGIAFVFAFLSLLLVHGFSGSTGLGDIKDLLNQQFSGASGQALTASSLLVYIIGTSGSSDPSGSVYQMILLTVCSLAIIWALRQAYASKLSLSIRVRDAFYRGMYPLVPFLLVALVILIELVPTAIGGFLYSTVVQNGIAVLFAEKLLWAILFGFMVLLTLYLVASTVFALYVVALPDMTPMRALRSSRRLVLHRRTAVLRKLIVLGLILLVAISLIMIPVILFIVSLASWVFFGLSMLMLVVVHSYVYALYRELLNE